jgi:hypothetical protein
MNFRTLTRYGLVLLGGYLAGSRLVAAALAWREWHQLAVSDPSAADLYRTDFWVEINITVLTLRVVGLVYWLLRPATAKR